MTNIPIKKLSALANVYRYIRQSGHLSLLCSDVVAKFTRFQKVENKAFDKRHFNK